MKERKKGREEKEENENENKKKRKGKRNRKEGERGRKRGNRKKEREEEEETDRHIPLVIFRELVSSFNNSGASSTYTYRSPWYDSYPKSSTLQG